MFSRRFSNHAGEHNYQDLHSFAAVITAKTINQTLRHFIIKIFQFSSDCKENFCTKSEKNVEKSFFTCGPRRLDPAVYQVGL